MIMKVKKKCYLLHKWSKWNYSKDNIFRFMYCKKCGKVQRKKKTKTFKWE